MGVCIWGETVGFSGVQVDPKSFNRAVRRAEYEGLPAQPLSLLDTCARVIALEMERDCSAMDLSRQVAGLAPDLQRLVCRDIFRFDHYQPAPMPSKEQLFGLRRAALQRAEALGWEAEAEEDSEGEDFWNEWRVSAAVACCGDGFDDEQYWEDPESGSGMDDWESGGPNQARPKRISQASRWEKGTRGMRGRIRRRPRLSFYHPEVFDNCGGDHGDRVWLRTVPNCFIFNQEDFRDARPGQQVAVVHGAVPSAREKLLLADAVRLLRLEPLAKEAQLVAVYTLNAG
ncbi:hypothetical protein COHA_005403 [Chlorella ohadii]|uniref:Uncharacterized protein n=1 Tax=Chlorella ohadii TaxID=2649997 RepID=A0AAD5H4R7_9CHLO|nr:hypothetical protein COHA_005403 [Chlorella ohadii]